MRSTRCRFLYVPAPVFAVALLICRQDREREFLDLAHQWLHVKLLKRFARFLKPGGANATADGELAFICRSCPIPGINLPENWESLPNA
jgi:hypothetical protein